MQRTLALLTSLILGIATLVVMIGFALFTTAPDSRALADERALVHVARYYEAVNEMIATGNPQSLYQVASSDVIESNTNATGAGSTGTLLTYLQYLHSFLPDVRLEADVYGDRAGVVALVSARLAPTNLPLGLFVEPETKVWPPVETFTLGGDRIVERRASWDGLTALTPAESLPVAAAIPARRELFVLESAFEPGAAGHLITLDAPAVVRVMSGALVLGTTSSPPQNAVIEVRGSSLGSPRREVLQPGQQTVLASGEVAVVDPGSALTLSNAENIPARLMSIIVGVPPGVDPEDRQHPFDGVAGVASRVLQRHSTNLLADGSAFQLGTAMLMPGARIAVAPATPLMILWSDDPGFQVAPGDGARHSDLPPGAIVLRPNTGEPPQYLFNAGSDMVTVRILAITPMYFPETVPS